MIVYFSMFVDIRLMLSELVLNNLFQANAGTLLRQAMEHIEDQMKAIRIV